MRKSLFPLAFVAALGMAGAALADESTGVVKSIDQTARTVTLEDGSQYAFPNKKELTTALHSFKPGDHVKITWHEAEGNESPTARAGTAIDGMSG